MRNFRRYKLFLKIYRNWYVKHFQYILFTFISLFFFVIYYFNPDPSIESIFFRKPTTLFDELLVRSILVGLFFSFLLFSFFYFTFELLGFLKLFFDAGSPNRQRNGFTIKRDEVLELEKRLVLMEQSRNTADQAFDTNEIASNITSQLSKTIDKSVLKEIEEKYSNEIFRNEVVVRASDVFEDLISRLEIERRVVSTRSIFNLIIGVCIAVSGMIILYDTVRVVNFDLSDWKNISLEIVARLSVVLVIEIFAYFFLNLYRSGLQEIKYYRNEITNIFARRIAFNLSLIENPQGGLSKLIDNFSTTVRNFVLKKGERTILSEYGQSASENSNNILDQASEAVGAVTGKTKASKK